MSIAGILANAGANETVEKKTMHESYIGRGKMSQLQLAMAKSSFVSRKVGETGKPAPIILYDEAVAAGGKGKENSKPNPSLDSHLQNIFKPSDDFSDLKLTVIDLKSTGYPVNDIIGGQDVPDEERYKTNAKRQMNGEAAVNKRPQGLKKVEKVLKKGAPPPSVQTISPITNLPLADYGTWVQDLDDSKKLAEMKAREEQMLKEENDIEANAENPHLRKLRTTLAARGVKGLASLAKRFRIMDDDHSGEINLTEFRKALRECKVGVADGDVSELFSLFDDDHSGSICYTEFISHLAGQLNLRRRKMVDLAFDVLDVDNNGVIELADIAAAYDVTRHPAFLSGERTKESILLEFLDGFDVGGAKDQKVTKDEFRNYYRAISAAIDSDDYFELMIRNAWHISGGDGVAANSTNIRVLVTHSDGTQSIVGLLNDIGVSPSNKKEILNRLRKQGVDVIAIPGYTDKTGNPTAAAAAAAQNDGGLDNDMQSAKRTSKAHRRTGNTVDSLRKQVAATSASKKHRAATETDTHPILLALREGLQKRGVHGFNGLQRTFRIIDDDNSRSIDRAEFQKGLHDMNILMSDAQLTTLFDMFDIDGSNTISYEEFIQGLRGEMSERRQRLVHMAFAILDKSGNGVVEPADMASLYDASRHPAVLSGASTPAAVLREFLDTFDVGGEVDGKVTKDEFVNYYANISASIDNDDYFELMIRNAWHLSGGEGQAANSANRRVLVTDAQGRQVVQEIKQDLGLRSDDKVGMVARLRAQGVDVSSLELYGFAEDKNTDSPTSMQIPVQSTKLSSKAPPVVRRAPPVQRGTQQLATNNSVFTAALNNSNTSKSIKFDNATMQIVRKFKDELKSRGAYGFVGLQRCFRTLDRDGNKTLSLEELKYGLRNLHLSISEQDISKLLAAADRDRSGKVDFEEFMQLLRDPLSPRRAALVATAFAVLDKDGNGMVDITEVADVYHASKHPEVIAGIKTENEVLREFLDTFDVGGEVDGKVTKDEFVNYYANISASIDNDDYFELMIRNAWHLSGGEGQAANSANRRVLVTDAQGRQVVQEIKQDLGLRSDDKVGMVARLRAQGVDAAKIDVTGAVDDEDAKPLRTTAALPEEDLATLRAKALKQFNATEFLQAAQTFEAIKALLRKQYPKNPNHPEFLKVEKSIELCHRKADGLHRSRGTQKSLKEKRLQLVLQAFSLLDLDNNGIIDLEEMLNRYSAGMHPAVISGHKTKEAVLTELMNVFEVGGEVDGKVTKDEFVNYYKNLSAEIPDDGYFELMIRNAWHLSGGEGQAANSANRRVLVTDAQGRQVVQEIKQDLGLRSDDKVGMVARLRAQGVDAAKIETTGVFTEQKTGLLLPNVSSERAKEVKVEVTELRKQAYNLFNSQKYAEAEQIFTMIKTLLQEIYASKMHPEVFQTQKSIDICRQKMSPPKMG